MKMVGIYHIALLPGADEDAFVSHVTDDDFARFQSVLQLTRVTSGFDHLLLKRSATPKDLRLYAWHVSVRLIGRAGYKFDENVERLQALVEEFGVVIGIDMYPVIAEQGGDTG